MISFSSRSGARRLRQGSAVLAAIAVLAAGTAGCGVIRAAKKVVDNVDADRATMSAFTKKIQQGPTTFEVTYATTGSSPAAITYAVEPPNGLAFSDTPSGKNPAPGDEFRFIVNPTGEFACTPPQAGATSKWSCEQLPKASAADYQNILDFYTPTHWVKFLNGLSIAAGFAGDKVSSSSLTVNGFAMSCVDLVAQGVPGTSTICTTQQNLLGYVKVAGDTTSFEIKSFSSSPASSLLQLPPGATITKVTLPSTTTTTTS